MVFPTKVDLKRGITLQAVTFTYRLFTSEKTLYLWTLTRLRRIVTCIGPNQKNQANLYLYLYLRYIFSQLLLMVSVSKYLKDPEDTPFMYLYRVRRYKIFVSVATLAADKLVGDHQFDLINDLSLLAFQTLNKVL